MRRIHLLVFAGLALAVTGCSLFSNPVARQEKAEHAVATSDRALTTEAQKEVATAKEALNAAPPSRPVSVAKDATGRADALLAQSNGPLSADDAAKRIALVRDLLSEEQGKRESAERTLATERATTAELSRENAALKQRLADAAEATKTWALERDATAKKWETMWFWIWCAVGLYGASIVVPIIAQVFSGGAAGPLLGLASRALGFVAAPAIQFAKDRAVGGLERVGPALEDFRQDAPQFAAKITRTFDSYTDADHQRVIGGAARTYRQSPVMTTGSYPK